MDKVELIGPLYQFPGAFSNTWCSLSGNLSTNQMTRIWYQTVGNLSLGFDLNSLSAESQL